jgi:subtilisin family serine protease
LTCAAAHAATPGWETKVHGDVLGSLAETGGAVEFLVILDEQADLTAARTFRTKLERGRFTFETLREVAGRSQAPLIAKLEALGADYRAYWITNMLWVRGSREVLAQVAGRPDVRRVDPNPAIVFDDLPGEGGSGTEGLVEPIEWNLVHLRADRVWEQGYTGVGVVIGGQDTGYEWHHPALVERYRGWDGSTATHDYNWHDAIHSTEASDCPADSPEPCDDRDHGTHTMGIMIGDDGGTNRIGMAPGARWIGCRNMDEGAGTPATYAECFQWFIAPTDANGENPDPSRAPHVINNSWTCPASEGCAPDTLLAVVDAVRAAGIVVVVSAGNGGPACGTVATPPANYDTSFSVGATDDTDTAAGFSARGPVTVDGSNRLKPDVSAPGVGIRSSIRGGDYASLSGTSMAGPHVAGLVALLLDARPDLIGRVDVIETIIANAAIPLTANETCGEIPGSAIPNNTYGHGRIDALLTLLGDADADGADNLADCAPADPDTWAPPGQATRLMLAGGPSTSLTWMAPELPGGLDPSYDLLRAESAADLASADCIESGLSAPFSTDDEIPTDAFFYVVRVGNRCGNASGDDSSGTPRAAAACP